MATESPIPKLGWYVDRSRFEQGYVCPWKRLLAFHANLTGLTPKQPNLHLFTGILVHRSLELLLRDEWPTPPTEPEAQAALASETAISERVADWDSGAPPFEPDVWLWIQDLTRGLTHGYARVVLPWLLQDFELVAIEREYTLDLPHSEMPIIWMARPDIVCRSRETGELSIHDFKTQGYWSDDILKEWSDSLQLMMNAHAVSLALGEPVPSYYVHFLIKGNQRYPSPLTHAWYRPASPPMEPEDWQIKKPYKRGGIPYQRVRVADYRSHQEWVWQLPAETINKQFVLAGPFPVVDHKIELFRRGLHASEWWWRESLVSVLQQAGGWDLDSPAFRAALDRTFPRTFKCYTYGARCSYYDLCLKAAPWQPRFTPRVPHHTTEVVDEG